MTMTTTTMTVLILSVSIDVFFRHTNGDSASIGSDCIMAGSSSPLIPVGHCSQKILSLEPAFSKEWVQYSWSSPTVVWIWFVPTNTWAQDWSLMTLKGWWSLVEIVWL